MKILQVLLSPRIGGAETLADSLSTEWSLSGASCKTHYLDADNSSTHSRRSRLVSLSRTIRAWQPDIVVSHSALPNLYSRLVAPRRLPVVAVLHSAGDDFVSRSLRWSERLVRLRTAAVVGVSQVQIDRYVAHFGTRVPVRRIPNGIRRDACPKERFQEVPLTAVTVARLAAQKNPHVWVQTARLLALQGPDLRLEWWGPNSVDGDLDDVFSKESLEGSRGSYRGATTDPVSALKSSDFLFHPADREAHSIGILEAAAVGLPVVCSESVAATLPPEIVAVSFTEGVAESAVEALKTVCDDWVRYAERALGAAPGIVNEFSISKCASKYAELFEELLRMPEYDREQPSPEKRGLFPAVSLVLHKSIPQRIRRDKGC
jgi:glycosyltransferase involved in cell wall biosynthesis